MTSASNDADSETGSGDQTQGRWFRIGVLISLGVLILAVFSISLLDPDRPASGIPLIDALRLTPNELGDLLAGVFAPLALVWVIIGFWQQSYELRQNTKAINTHVIEIKRMTESHKKQVELMIIVGILGLGTQLPIIAKRTQ